jgi:hypothetical protein
MKIITTAIIVLVFTGVGCKSLFVKKYKIGREFTFASKREFSIHVFRQFKIPKENILFVDSASYGLLVNEIVSKNLSIYYGSFINDSTEIKFSDNLRIDNGCIGRIEQEVYKNLTKVDSPRLRENQNFRKYIFYRFIDNSKYEIAKSAGDIKVFFLYSYSMGTYYDKYFNEISSMKNFESKNPQVYVISMDPLWTYKD